jgi:C4-dicarboxylate transporter DctM subunit
MDVVITSSLCVIGMLVLMMAGVPIVYSLGFTAIIGMTLVWGGASLAKVGSTAFYLLYNQMWTPLPLFVLMACIISETRIGEDIFKAISNWLSRLPGGLVVASIIGEAAMAAMIGTSTATTITVGKVAIPEMEKLGYDRGFSMGALLAGGVLGPLIPPSATMIIYAILSEVSLGKLFIAGVVPGIVLAIMFSLFAFITCLYRPDLAPRPPAVSWRERFFSIRKIWPLVLVMVCILGGIYMGVVTATEAAGAASFVVMIIAIAFFGLRLKGLAQAMMETALINAMILFIFVAALMFSYMVGSSGLAEDLVNLVAASAVSRWIVMIMINVTLLILGCFIDGITIMVLTLPLFIPLIVSLGFDPLWFGIVLVTNMEIALITPPMGINLFAIRTAFGVPIGELLRGVLPFLLVLIVFLGVVIAFPQLSIWLPGLMRK